MNRDNLQKLANYLLSGKLNAHFDMCAYEDTQSWNYTGIGRDDCGTVGCAIGHGPYAGISKDVHEDWLAYSERVFYLNEEQWCFCFYADWEGVDNTPEGAAKRILYLLKFGIPDNWNYDQKTVDEYTSKIIPFLPG